MPASPSAAHTPLPGATTEATRATPALGRPSTHSHPEIGDDGARRIVTRTGSTSAVPLYDRYAAEGERTWGAQEDAALIDHYAEGRKVAQIAVAMQIDTKDVATRLIRLLLDPAGTIDDDDSAPNARKRYTDADHRRMQEAYDAGTRLSALARELGRSQLGVGWRMVDLHIPDAGRARRRR